MVAKVTPEERKCLICPNTFLVGGSGNGRREKVYCSWACRSSAKINTNGRLPNRLTVPQAAYLAGMLDADGHMGLYVHTSKPGANATYRPSMNVSNTDLTLLNWIVETTGVGSVNKQRAETSTKRATFQWNCSVAAIAPLLEQMIEFMIVKRDRAELIIDYWARIQDPLLKADKSWQLEYRDKMLRLNKRGPKDVDHIEQH
ncbi:hypothetical protein AB0K16_22585 [Nonomuraea jabiensis]|uniref:hypothetical protein n=1 Tax=Nonomuraea jabiensis TaxID=882448 RepID=UPI00344017F3